MRNVILQHMLKLPMTENFCKAVAKMSNTINSEELLDLYKLCGKPNFSLLLKMMDSEANYTLPVLKENTIHFLDNTDPSFKASLTEKLTN
mmetsp:Transcript_16088/g.11602  ORF Transcript_16088/g.11602 Transcript_16088/m.11602 type:complete len:90 (-) Transcript_16088:1501-1770(-)